MAAQEINLELLLGKRVLARNGRSIGRLEEVQGELKRGSCFVTEFHVGSYAAFERLAAVSIGRALLRLLHLKPRHYGYRVKWDQLDLSDPTVPRLLCEIKALEPLRNGKANESTPI
jgi:hypothetical protein